MSYSISKRKGPMSITEDNAIDTGRFLNRVEYRCTDADVEFFTIEIIDREGFTARKSYFKPEIGKGFIKDEEELQKQQQKFSRVMKNLMFVLHGSDFETGQVSGFKEFCDIIRENITHSMMKKEMRVKVVLDKDNRPTLPNYPLIFEDANVSPEDSKLRILEYDKVNPSVNEEEFDKDSKPSTSTIPDLGTEEKKDDLPF